MKRFLNDPAVWRPEPLCPAAVAEGVGGGDGGIGRAEVNYGAAIGLSTPVPRGLGGGA